MMPIELYPQSSPHAVPVTASSVSLRGVRKAFGATQALDGIDLDIAAGEFAAVIGPSGCGKSSLLRVIAGLEDADEGEVRIGRELVNDVAAKDRNLAMVFQSYALYPHLTVFRNLALPLEVRKLDRTVVERRVERAAEMLDITYLLNRRPGLLSGGQRQRVALARALVREAPLYLLDEPLSHLDAPQRRQQRAEIRSMHRRLGATLVYATHDQSEAMAMADRIVVMNEGRIEQVATPDDLLNHPASRFVEGFLRTETISQIADNARRAIATERLQ
jgi:ABC-type sugar transport system ATPase subunit